MKPKVLFLFLVSAGLLSHSLGFDLETDIAAVRAILDLNGLNEVEVADVTTVTNSRITWLRLRYTSRETDTNLPKPMTVLPAHIGDLTELSYLELSGNELVTVPAEIGALRNLTTLRLHTNQLTHLPAEIGNLVNLEKLYLAGNRLTHLPKEFGNLTKLTELYLDWNRLVDVPSEIGNLTALHVLGLGSNCLSELPSEIGNLANLGELTLASNKLSSVPVEICRIFRSGIWLDLSCNNLTTLPFSVTSFPQGVFIGQNKLCNVDDSVKAWLDVYGSPRDWRSHQYCDPNPSDTAAVRLLLDTNNLVDVPVKDVSYLLDGRITKLNLRNRGISLLPPEIGFLSELEILLLGGNKLTSLPHQIGSLSKIVYLYMERNLLTRLPDSICMLSPRLLEVRGNHLCDVSPHVREWLDMYSTDIGGWQKLQNCDVSVVGLHGGNVLVSGHLHLSVIPGGRNGVDFRVEKDVAGDMSLNVRDVFGRLVWHHQSGGSKPGFYTVTWPLGPKGAVGNGIYLVSLQQGNRQISRRFTIVR